MFVFVMIEAIMLGELLRAEASATSIRFRNAGAANRCCCDPRSTTESAEKAPATLRLISSGSVYAITARPMMPLLRTRAEGASERTEARSGSGVRRRARRRRTGGVDSRPDDPSWLVGYHPHNPHTPAGRARVPATRVGERPRTRRRRRPAVEALVAAFG